MSFDVKTYSPSDVVFTFGGYVVQGWDRITITRIIPAFKQINGIRGKNTRVRSGNTAATVEIDLVMSSDTNIVFSEIVKQDEIYGGARIVAVIKDTLGSELFSTEEGYLESPAIKSYESDSGNRSWRLNCLSSKTTDTGSGSPLGSLIDNVTSLFA